MPRCPSSSHRKNEVLTVLPRGGWPGIKYKALEPPRLEMNAPLGTYISVSLDFRGAGSRVRLRRARALWPQTRTRFRRMGISGFYS